MSTYTPPSSSAAVKLAVAAGLAQFSTVWPRSAGAVGGEDLAAAYSAALFDQDPEAITLAVTSVLRECEFFPKPAEWLKHTRMKARELYERRTATVQPAKVPQYGSAEPTHPTWESGRFEAHLTMTALAVSFGPELAGAETVNPGFGHVWRALWDRYQTCSEATGDFPTIDILREFVTAGGADMRILEAALQRAPSVMRSHGISVRAAA